MNRDVDGRTPACLQLRVVRGRLALRGAVALSSLLLLAVPLLLAASRCCYPQSIGYYMPG